MSDDTKPSETPQQSPQDFARYVLYIVLTAVSAIVVLVVLALFLQRDLNGAIVVAITTIGTIASAAFGALAYRSRPARS